MQLFNLCNITRRRAKNQSNERIIHNIVPAAAVITIKMYWNIGMYFDCETDAWVTQTIAI